MKPAFFSGLLTMALGAVLAICCLAVLPQCHADHPMACNWMMRAAAGAGIVVAVLGVAIQFAKRDVALGLQIANIVNGVFISAIATVLIGACPNPMMACHATSEGVVAIFGGIIALLAACDAWRLSRQS